ncbi:MAG: helix-turn-helix transcriptional regulator [Pirellulales bacterium]|nr:helix-turn-helix transcriptional regulator [Pirellulales bacterium]
MKEFAERTGIAQQTISRWMDNVQVQSRVLDNLMRLFFRSAEAGTTPMDHPAETDRTSLPPGGSEFAADD